MTKNTSEQAFCKTDQSKTQIKSRSFKLITLALVALSVLSAPERSYAYRSFEDNEPFRDWSVSTEAEIQSLSTQALHHYTAGNFGSALNVLFSGLRALDQAYVIAPTHPMNTSLSRKFLKRARLNADRLEQRLFPTQQAKRSASVYRMKSIALFILSQLEVVSKAIETEQRLFTDWYSPSPVTFFDGRQAISRAEREFLELAVEQIAVHLKAFSTSDRSHQPVSFGSVRVNLEGLSLSVSAALEDLNASLFRNKFARQIWTLQSLSARLRAYLAHSNGPLELGHPTFRMAFCEASRSIHGISSSSSHFPHWCTQGHSYHSPWISFPSPHPRVGSPHGDYSDTSPEFP